MKKNSIFWPKSWQSLGFSAWLVILIIFVKFDFGIQYSSYASGCAGHLIDPSLEYDQFKRREQFKVVSVAFLLSFISFDLDKHLDKSHFGKLIHFSIF